MQPEGCPGYGSQQYSEQGLLEPVAWKSGTAGSDQTQRVTPGGTVAAIPSHDEYLLDDRWCACGSTMMFRRRSIMGEHGEEVTFAAWCTENPDHRLPEAMIREIAELRSQLGT
jgi:hypothetical protein